MSIRRFFISFPNGVSAALSTDSPPFILGLTITRMCNIVCLQGTSYYAFAAHDCIVFCFRVKVKGRNYAYAQFGEVYKKGLMNMSDLYNRIAELCQNYGITITAMCRESGASRASLSDLKVGRKQNLSTETLDKIADYFGTTVDYLLGRTDDPENNDRFGLDISDDEIRELEETKKAPTPEGERPITFDDFTYAFYNESKDLPDEKKKMLLDMARFMKADLDKEKGE